MAQVACLAPDARRLMLAARVISDLLSPAALAVPALALGVWASDVPGTYLYALLYFAVAVPVPLAYLLWLLRTGRITDFHLPDRRERTGPFAVASGSALSAVGLLFYLHAPDAFLVPLVAALAQTLMLFAITLVWQISIHSATSAGLATFGFCTLGRAALVLSLLVPLVIWARLYLRRHTLMQTLAGAAVGSGAFAAVFFLHAVLW
ncbi:MAG: hypothetical protein DWQ37_05765 [Planctomycetota bacterium]|nr:MAG: hypothetical protein DWQ37_05765 [Planctomycetota bacterium]